MHIRRIGVRLSLYRKRHPGCAGSRPRWVGFSPTYLRNATAFGVSPRLRGDVVVNNLVGHAVTTGHILIMSDGTPWRPLVHVEDICHSFLKILEAPRHLVHDQAFNVGSIRD